MPQQDNTFEAGLQLDADPQYQPANSYRDAQHLLRTAGGNLAGERAPFTLGVGPALPLVGACALGGEEVLFFSDGTSAELGVLRGDVYTAIITAHPDFALGPRVSCTARLDYRGHRLVYWADGLRLAWLDLDAPLPADLSQLALLAAVGLPAVSVLSVGQGGSLPTGIYQACVCLLSASKNPLGYSLFTNPVPVIDEGLSNPPAERDGAPPQTPATGSITFAVDHLAPGYAYAQLIVATYTGVSNQLQLFRLPLIALGGRTSLSYTYSAPEQHQEPVELAEVLVGLADYNAATVVLQKDGHLLAANVASPVQDDVDWQGIANAIVLGSAIKEVPYRENDGPGSYKDPLLAADSRGFQRGEVYSFSFTPIVGGRVLDAYHIPGYQQPRLGVADPAGVLGTYYSQEAYPAHQGYPAGLFGGTPAVRHHRLPDVAAEPLLSNATADAATLRVLGIRELTPPDFTGLTPAQLLKLDGYLIGVQPRTAAHRSILAQGIAQPLIPANGNRLMVSPFNGKYPAVMNDAAPRAKGDGQLAAFYSPETAILGDAVAGVTNLMAVGEVSGTSFCPANELGLPAPKDKYAAVFLDLWALTPPRSAVSLPLLTVGQAYVAAGNDYAGPALESGNTLYGWQQNGYLLLRTDLARQPGGFYAGLPDNAADVQYTDRAGRTDELQFRQASGGTLNQNDAQRRGVAWRYLYNLVRDQPRQYGALEQATYQPLGLRRTGDAPAPFFGGDTFIGKVALQSNTAYYEDQDNTGLRFRTLSYYFCESTVNTGYRHYLASSQGGRGTLPYYPRLKDLWNASGTGVMQYPSDLGHATGYNRQYSFTNALDPLRPRDATVQRVTAFPNRVLYSQQAVEGEQLDAYRVFRANDYHDLPKDRGPITDLWDWDNRLYAHTRQALYHSFFNEATTQTTSEGEVYLGNGGAFSRPSLPVLTMDGGYAGCQDPQASVSGPTGRFFVDREGQKVYLFTGQLQEISGRGLYNFFRGQLPEAGPLRGGYDHANDRYVLYGLPAGNLSWCARNKAWVSFSQLPVRYAFGTQRRLLLDQPTGLAVANEGIPLAAELTLVANLEPAASKVFDALIYQASQVPVLVAQATADVATGPSAVVLLTAYGQLPGPGETLARQSSHQLQLPVGRGVDEDRPGEFPRLKGKWMSATTRWAAAAVPVLIKQIAVLLKPTYR